MPRIKICKSVTVRKKKENIALQSSHFLSFLCVHTLVDRKSQLHRHDHSFRRAPWCTIGRPVSWAPHRRVFHGPNWHWSCSMHRGVPKVNMHVPPTSMWLAPTIAKSILPPSIVGNRAANVDNSTPKLCHGPSSWRTQKTDWPSHITVAGQAVHLADSLSRCCSQYDALAHRTNCCNR